MKKRTKGIAILLLCGVAVAYVLWATSGFVSAFLQIKRAHIFPTSVSAIGWSSAENALTQELSPQAPFASFSESNSAFISIASSTPTVSGGGVVSTPVDSGGGSDVPPTIPVGQPDSTSSTTPTESTTTLPSESTPSSDSTTPAPTNSTTSVPVNVLPDVLPPQIVPPTDPQPTPAPADVPAAPATPDAAPSSFLHSLTPLVEARLNTFASSILSHLATVAFATTSGDDTTSSSTDLTPPSDADASSTDATTTTQVSSSGDSNTAYVATCEVLGTACHMIAFKDFTVGGSLQDKQFKNAELNFSFANLATEGGTLDGKVTARYFHNGHWRSAGEIYLNKEISNATNGGYFSQKLDDITSWNDLSDVKVVLEYEPGNGGGSVQLYVDALWIDAVYLDPVQDVLAGHVTPPTDAPQNISFNLPAGDKSATALVLADGQNISFPFLDTLTDDTLALRANKLAYTATQPATSTTVYTSVTNTQQNADTFTLYTSFPGGKGEVTEFAQYLRNVPDAATSSQTSDVNFFCDGGWQASTSSSAYLCPSTNESLSCVSLSESGTNCLVHDVAVGVSTSTTYSSTWVPLDMNRIADTGQVKLKGLTRGYKAAYASAKTFEILPGQTVYFKMVVATPDTDKMRFIVSAKGSSYFGDLDSLHLHDETSLSALKKIKKVHVNRDAINEQLSEKSDFNVDELPQFQFKFKTQRSFFNRVKDTLLQRTVPYNVQHAQLRHESGEIEHLPVDVVYADNGEWTLKLEKTQRAFRPGKYSIDLTMDEGGSTYTDTVPFYWGVLAVNPDKSSYSSGDTAHLSIAALDDSGNTMCDSELALSITDPSGNTSDVPVVSGGGCGHNNITALPDFVADYPVTDEGDYVLTLSRLDDVGNIVTSVSDTLHVKNDAPYVVTRSGPTRIYPPSAYTMHMNIVAPVGYAGTVVETLPEGFTLGDTDGATVSRADGVIYLSWNVAIGSSSQTDLFYTFKAPAVSPYMYSAGPLKLNDNAGEVFKEGRMWKIASDAVSIATGVAWLTGNQVASSTAPTNLNDSNANAIAWNLSNDYDTTYFTASTTSNNTQLIVNQDGDYLVALTVPMERADTTASRTVVEADIRVNTSKVYAGVSRAFIRTTGTVNESSNHLYMLLKGLRAGSYIEAYLHQTNPAATDVISIGTQASLYAEYIGNDQSVYFGLATTTTGGNSLNPASTSTLAWYDDSTLGRSDAIYSHNNTTASTTITLTQTGSYMVLINIPETGSTTNENPKANVLINGWQVSGGEFKQGYISNNPTPTDASLHWSGVVTATTSNSTLSVTVRALGAAGTVLVNNDQASIYVQKLPSSGVYFATATTTRGGSNWNAPTATSSLWTVDNIKDATVYTHSTTTNSHQITVLAAGDYLLTLNDNHAGALNSSNEITSISVNGSAKSGAQTKTHFIAAAGMGQQTSGSLVYLLRDLAVNDVVTVTTVQEAAVSGTIITEDQPAQLMLWHKSAQSNFIQNSQWWYTNVNAEPPTDPWPSGGASNVLEGAPLTTGTSVKTGDVLRLRMSLTANANTIAGADSFKLQYAPGDTCSAALAWSDVAAIGSTTGIWRGYDNAGVAAGSTLSTNVLTASASTTETYEEQNPSAVTPHNVNYGSGAEWDWVLQDNGAPVGTSYCFRMVQASGQVLKDYLDYPLLITNNTPDVPSLDTLFDNEKTASTTPFFTFSTADDNTETVHYEIQVSSSSAFTLTDIDDDSVTNFSKFHDQTDDTKKAPFPSDDEIQYIPTATLTNGVTYWWRVRAKDPNGTNTWSSYSSARSFTVDTSVTVSTWFQTTKAQFNTDTLSQVESTSTDNVGLTSGFTSGTIYSPEIDYSSKTTGNSWGAASSTITQTGGTVLFHIEYLTSTSSWALIPDTYIPGNTAGTSTSPIPLTQVDPSTYSSIRVRADFTKTTNTAYIYDWQVSWALSVAAPTLVTPFDNEKVSTTTPTFTFNTTDPQGDKLLYQIEWSTLSSFASGTTTRTSDINPTGFIDVSSSTQSSPYVSGDTISYTVQTADRLASSTTYWWHVRAKDPNGGNAYSLWSSAQSFTTDTTVQASTWFQTTNEQFNTDTLTRTGSSGGDVTATSTTGNIAIFRAAAASEGIFSTTTFENSWDTTVRKDSIYTLTAPTTGIQLLSGHYAVMYGVVFSGLAGTNRSEVQSNLNLASTSLPAGWSQGFIRRNVGAQEGFTSGGAIIKVAADNDTLKLQSFRTDANTTAPVYRLPNTSGIELIKLDDAWSYLRLSKTGKQTGPISSSWIPVTYDREDEIDTTAYGHAVGGSNITLKAAGHYLVFANTYGSLANASTISTVVDQKLKLDNTDIDGSFTTVYTASNTNSNGAYQGAASIGMIIQSTTSNQVLTVQVARSAGTSAWTINGSPTGTYKNRTALTIVKLPEADFIRLTSTSTPNMIPTTLTAIGWNTEAEKDTSFTHSTTTSPSFVTASTSGDYLALGALYVNPGTTTNAEFNQGWRKNVLTFQQYGQAGGYNPAVTSDVGNWSGTIFPSMNHADFFEIMTQALGSSTAANSLNATKKGLQALRIASLSEADTNAKTIVSPDILFSSGTGPKWSTYSWHNTLPASTALVFQLQYLDASSTYSLVPDSALPGNAAGFGTASSSVDISGLSRTTYSTLRTKATFTCAAGTCPNLNDWTVSWSQGINISGTAKQSDQTTNATYGTVGVAVNGVLQSTKTGTISAGTWSIANVTAFTGDIITVFVSTSTATTKAVAVTKYTTAGDISGMALYQNHLTLGSNDNPTLTNTDIDTYDNATSSNNSIFYDVTGGNLNTCTIVGCASTRLLIKSGTTYQPGGNVTTPNMQIDGTFVPQANTVTVAGSWQNNGVFTKGTSSVIFSATSTTETINSSAATTSNAFYNVTFGSGASTATWNLLSPLSASSTLSINFGTLKNGTSTLFLSGDLSIGASGVYTHGYGSTTFMGSGTNTWTDSTAATQDMGDVIVDGSSKTIQLGSNVKGNNITIGADDTLNASASNYNISLFGNWTNNNSFVAQNGSVLFIATTTGKTIAPGTSSFYNLYFNGIGGNWSFSSATTTVSNDFMVASGTVTLPTATTTIGGAFDASSTGLFVHNNGTVLFNTSGVNKLIRPGTSTFFEMVFNGSGSWTISPNATTSRNFIITSGTVTLPSGVLAVGSNFTNAGTFTHNSGTVKFTSTATGKTITAGSSSFNNLLFNGLGGAWTISDTNATAAGDFTITNGSTTLPTGTFTVGGSFVNSGTFTHHAGLVKLTATAAGKSVTASTSPFYDLQFNSSSGGWTVTANASTTHDFTVTSASSIALASSTTFSVGGTFTNLVGGSATSFGSSTLSLTSGTSYTINTKIAGGDVYGQLLLGAGTNIRMWASSAINTSINATASLYSQNHASSSGSLFIYGAFSSANNENWSYATDFDGTALTGAFRRQVQVQVASSSSVTITNGNFNIVGTSTASTTISTQGVGAFAFSITGGTTTAQYYSVSSTTAPGLSISGSTIISSLANGDYTLNFKSGGSAMTVASTVINQNPALQIQQVRFATSSGVTSGFNVTESGSPTSYWWFRNHYGNFAGEAYDNDPGPSSGNPGYIRWDDSGYVITVAGHVYSNHGTTVIGNPPCDGSTNVVTVVVGGSSFTGSCAAGTGAYSIAGVTYTGDVPLTAFLNTNGGKQAVTVTKTPTADISNLDLYQNTLVVRHEGVNAMTIADLAVYDSTKDSDVFFTAATSSTNTLVLQPEHELDIWTGMTFAPGGNVTLQSGGSGDVRDGRLFIATSSTFTAAGTEAHSIGGGLVAESGSTFTPANSTVTFAATTTGKSIYAQDTLSFYNLIFNGSGGRWSVDSTTTPMTITNALTLTAGTLAGTGSVTVQNGNVTGNASISMTGGTFLITSTGNFGSSNSWQFSNLTFGDGVTTNTSTSTATATTTISGVLTVAANQTLNAGSGPWVLTGAGTPFVKNGTFNVQSAPVTYSATGAANITNTNYAALFLAPSAAGSPTYTLGGGTPTILSLAIGNGTNPVTVTADTNDPSVAINGNFLINSTATYIASNTGLFTVAGDWTNRGTFTHSGAGVTFNATTTGHTITASTSPFYDVTFNSSSGGWTVAANATTSHDFTLSNVSNFTVASGTVFAVSGTFTNAVGGSATTFASSTLALKSGTSYTINTRTTGGDTYGTLDIGASTNIRMWNSSAATTTTNASGSLYSQNHAGVNGALYIYGAYTRSSGSDYWSYATDFDGTDISGSPRKVDVYIASSSSLTFSGGVLDIIGDFTASTTIQNQGVGAYAIAVTGGTLFSNYYEFRNMNASGLTLSGSPTITSLDKGDFLLGVASGTTMTVASSVIDANPLKVIRQVKFATTTSIRGANVTATGSSVSSWKFSLHYGNLAGEAYDMDPTGDPGYLRWDDSAAQITISGHVYSDEGVTAIGSPTCDNATANVKLVVQGSTSYTAVCDSSTGAFSIPGVSFNPGDTLTLFLDTNGGARAANVTVDPSTNIVMDLYQNRVIVRHEDTAPITIAKIGQYTSFYDSDVPFATSSVSGNDTLTLPPNTKLIVWTGKTFAPAGNVIINSGSAVNAYDGTLEVQANASFSAAGSQVHSIGGSLTFDSGATLVSGNSTFTFTATTTGKTITPPASSSFYTMSFTGIGGNWAFAGNATTTNDFNIASGTVTLPTGFLTVGGSFNNTYGAFQHNNGTVVLNATAAGKNIRVGTSTMYNLTTNGSGGGWSFFDTNATTSNNLNIAAGTLTLPSGILVVGSSFTNSGGAFTHNSGTVKFVATTNNKNVQAGGSKFANLLFNGAGATWAFLDTNATTTGDVTIVNGTTTLPSGVFEVGGSFVNSSLFSNNNGVVKFTATATGKSVTASTSPFYDLQFNSSSGGWTVTANATTTHDFTLTSASSFALASSTTFSVGGTFTNLVGGSATALGSSTIALKSGTSYTINTKSAGGDIYGKLDLSASTNIRMWNSSAINTAINSTASLYSQNHAAVSGALYIYGAYSRSTGSDYWDYATDFDGTALGGGSRQVAVQIASSSTITLSGGTLEIVGSATASTTIANQGVGAYAFTVTGGTLNAQYYQVRNTDSNGLNFSSGTPIVSSLSNGDFLLAQTGASMITLAGTAIDANAGLHISAVKFATSSGVTSGFNVNRTGSPSNAWTFTAHYGNYAGEAYDNDGGDACGKVRWDDSSCLLASESHYRWRNDDGGEGALSSTWYNNSWAYRKRIAVTNPNATTYTNLPVKLVVTYDSNMKADFSDLRFTSSDGTTLIPYFIESTVASASSTVWVNIPSLSASSNATIYMYYGNAGASDASDGSNTFSFYDSFESNSLSGYSGDTGTKFNTGTTFGHIGTYGLDAGTHVGERTTNGIYRTGSQTAQGQTIRFYQYVDASQQDEPCTYFGLASAGHNYAVCLDEYPSMAIEIAKNVTSNDGSGTVLASTGVTYTTGWYEVSIDWLTTNAINVTVYNSTGAVFATLNTTDSTYTSAGGMGFGYWGQNGGWDYYTSRTYVPVAPTAIFGSRQGNNGATWAAAEDTALSGLAIGSNIRLRFSVQNTGSTLATQFQLQYAPKGSALNCESVPYGSYVAVPVASSCTLSGEGACMTESPQFTNLASTSPSLTYPASMNFAAGYMMSTTSNKSNGMSLASNTATEVEYNFAMNTNASGNKYCFRTSENGTDLDNYDHVAEATILHPPTLSNISFNHAQDIALTEGASTTISVTASTTDLNGYTDITSATSTMFRSGVGSFCSADENNCYKISASSCTFSSCSGNVCSLSCSAKIQYLADPTDSGTYAAQNWYAQLHVVDSSNLSDTATSSAVDLLTLYGLALNTSVLDFGSLNPGSDTGAVDAATTISNTGNSPININVSGNSLTGPGGGADTIDVGQQKYATTTFTYGSCALCQTLTGAATNVAVAIAKPVSTTTPSTKDVYWGISVPVGRNGTYSGSNTIDATSP